MAGKGAGANAPRACSYVALTLAQTAYAYFVERDVVFVGKRKTLDKRVRPFFPFLTPSPAAILTRHPPRAR